ncbi:conserved hypothetical protein [Flavobacterium psychrophilum]|uniref:phage major capsid protein n=1 Tax=Flavobacterium psychrophilum TaxID=96345 RepID=UPI000B7C1BEC|nr:hypothetical protein [Flavobacterium psychrophilum]EKT3957687.1 hypothetical protein [Flavobacterium psychrophilum]EKT4510349.1 hypothetical protein [Flavobacterium psychrophilum]SNA83358.1 conserved hypothetical protein [Flavobacterium psychrophilum]
MAGINQEIWTDVAVEQFRATEDARFLNEIPDESGYVTATRGDNEVIHLNDIGVDPEVLINNTTYPLPVASQNDDDIAITLDKYQTAVTKVSDDELEFIAYDKIAKVQEKHTKAIMRKKHAKAIHALAPASNTVATPVLITTGPDDGTGRKRLLMADILTLKKAFNKAKIDIAGRVLVLCSDHFGDLEEDGLDKQKYAGQFIDEDGGLLKQRLFGFKTYWNVENPSYTVATKVKVSFGAVLGAGTQEASVAFFAPDMFKASGKTKSYVTLAEARNQQNEYSMRHNYIVLPRKQRAIGAIVSGTV